MVLCTYRDNTLLNLTLVRLFCCLVILKSALAFSYSRNIIIEKSTNDPQCGYITCPNIEKDKLNVHIVAHTHDDVGWLKTPDQYYYGNKNVIQKAGVQYILDSVVQELLKDPSKRFIFVEIAFFYKWWHEQTTEVKEKVKQLVEESRLEFISGAWSMNDEATTHYQSIIDQFTFSLRFLDETFGDCARPRIGWQIDPFGHSREMASILARMDFDGLFFGRLDHEDKDQRMASKTPEMVWKASSNLGASSNLFTGILYNLYQPPPGFCFDILCADEPIIDDISSPDYNVDRRIEDFIAYIQNMSHSYQTNNVLITMGEDFFYQDANMWYKNLDKLIKYSNLKNEMNLFYSTPSCYLKSLYDANITWPIKTEDFFPYSSDSHSFWTGYYTSRPTLKRYERIGNHFLQICKQITALSFKNDDAFETHLHIMKEAMGVMQHHDAVTGTEKESVAYDYARTLDVAFRSCEHNVKNMLNEWTGMNDQFLNNSESLFFNKQNEFEFESCLLLNISVCNISENSPQFMVTTYNPLAHTTYQYVRFPVADGTYTVTDYKGTPVLSQIVPVDMATRNLPFRHSNSAYELVFLANEVPQMGFKSFFVSRDLKNDKSSDNINKAEKVLNEEVTIGNEQVQLTFNSKGFLSSISSNGIRKKVFQNFYFYEAFSGNNRVSQNRSSGAYIFRPKSKAKPITDKVDIHIIRGELVDIIHQNFTNWITQVIRVYKTENYVEFEWTVGPIPIADSIGKEIIVRYDSDISSNGIFYTDSNGREMMKRKLNHRDTWIPQIKEPIAGNYYPITTKIAIEDDYTRLAILVDRAQGGSSIFDGSIEIMLHRRLLHDDAFGVNEALNEIAYGKGLVARGNHYLLLGRKHLNTPTIYARERFLQLKQHLPNWLFFSDTSKYSFEEWRTQFTHIYSGLALSLPQNIHILTFEPWHKGEKLLRFEHIIEQGEDPKYSKPVVFNVQDIFRNLNLHSLWAATLDGNQMVGKIKRLNFKTENFEYSEVKNISFSSNIDEFIIQIKPMEIKTYHLIAKDYK